MAKLAAQPCCSPGQILASLCCIVLSLCIIDQRFSAPQPMMLHVDEEFVESPSYYSDSFEATQEMDGLRSLRRGGGSSRSSSSRGTFGRSYGNCYGDRCDNVGGTDGTTVAIIIGSIVGICCLGVFCYSGCLWCMRRRKDDIKKARRKARRAETGRASDSVSCSDSDAPREPIVIHPNEHMRDRMDQDYYNGEPTNANSITASNLAPMQYDQQQKVMNAGLAPQNAYEGMQAYPQPMATPVLPGQGMYPQQTQGNGGHPVMGAGQAPHVMGASQGPSGGQQSFVMGQSMVPPQDYP